VNGGERLVKCERSSALFCFFAQWFTDSFLRTDPNDRRRNTSNHEIDLCQIYGLDAATARTLRSGRGGRLRMDPRLPFPEHLYNNRRIKAHFLGLPYVAHDQAAFEAAMNGLFSPAIAQPARRKALYATGLERGNSTILYTAISTVFIREHNRICAALARKHTNWDDDRLFETARNVNIVLLLRVIVEEYINHLAGTPDHKFSLQRDFAERQRWYRTNRISLEFDLLYRWHSLVTDSLVLDGRVVPAVDFRFNNAMLEDKGAEPVIDQASRQFAGRIGLHNSPSFLIPADRKALEMGRDYRLMPYNDYRRCFGMPPCKSYDELTGCPELSAELRALYGDDIDKLELLVGLMAEQRPPGAILSSLMGTMVGVDAFSQALTNPLLSGNVYGEMAFSEIGLGIIDDTRTFKDIVRRNRASGRRVGYVGFDVTQVPQADRL
jgi:prostaglandin-endoperoxide synthase 2